MNIEIKKSKKPIKYSDAIKFMESRLIDINQKGSKDLIWILEHEDIYTAGTSYKVYGVKIARYQPKKLKRLNLDFRA